MKKLTVLRRAAAIAAASLMVLASVPSAFADEIGGVVTGDEVSAVSEDVLLSASEDAPASVEEIYLPEEEAAEASDEYQFSSDEDDEITAAEDGTDADIISDDETADAAANDDAIISAADDEDTNGEDNEENEEDLTIKPGYVKEITSETTLTFTPPATGMYEFQASGDYDFDTSIPEFSLYDSKGNTISPDRPSKWLWRFSSLTGGETYTVKAGYSDPGSTFEYHLACKLFCIKEVNEEQSGSVEMTTGSSAVLSVTPVSCEDLNYKYEWRCYSGNIEIKPVNEDDWSSVTITPKDASVSSYEDYYTDSVYCHVTGTDADDASENYVCDWDITVYGDCSSTDKARTLDINGYRSVTTNSSNGLAYVAFTVKTRAVYFIYTSLQKADSVSLLDSSAKKIENIKFTKNDSGDYTCDGATLDEGTYYIELSAPKGAFYDGYVTLSDDHEWSSWSFSEDGTTASMTCSICGETVKRTVVRIYAGTPYTIDSISEADSLYQFIPDRTSLYVFSSSDSSGDPNINIYDSDGVFLGGATDVIDDEGNIIKYDFTEEFSLTGGSPYYIESVDFGDSDDGKETYVLKVTEHAHTWGDWVKTADSTYTTEGTQARTCTAYGCGAVETRKMAVIPHTHDWSWVTTAEPTALSQGTRVGTCTICKAAQTLSIQKLTPYITLNVSGTIPMKVKQKSSAVKVTGLQTGDRVVSWTSSNPKAVKVSSTGKLTAGKSAKKTATITVTTAAGATASFKVKTQKGTVKSKKISVASKNVQLSKKQKFSLTSLITPVTTQQKLTYSTSNKKVAAVSKKGVVTAKKKGKATITIKSGSKKVKVKITVK